MKRAAAYARFSTEKQYETSVEKQLEDIREYCEKKGYTIVREYVDRAESAAKEDRPAFQQLLADARQKLFDVVVVHKLNRFARNRYLSVVAAHELKEYGISIESVLEPISDDPVGQLLWGILDAVNEFERLQTIQEIKLKMRPLAQKGYWLGGRAPFGFKAVRIRAEDGKMHTKLEVDEEEAPIVREVFRLFNVGHSFKEIAEKLNRRQLYRRGKHWTASSVSDTVRNSRYVGMHFWGKGTKKEHKIVRDDAIFVNGPAIVDRDTWNRAQERLRKFYMHKGRPARHHYLLRGLAFCECGAPLHGRFSKSPLYTCRDYKEGASKHVSISSAKLEGFVKGYIERILDKSAVDFELLAKSINEHKRTQAMLSENEKLELLEEAKTLEETIVNLTAALAKTAPHAQGIIIQQLNEKTARLEEIKKQLSSIEDEVFFVTPSQLEELYDSLIEKLKDERLEDVIRTMVKRVTVYKSGFIDIETAFIV